MPKHIFVTGGVASSLGKGLTASSLGRLLKMRGLRVTMQKLDPYINVDPGTMNPFEHGEVFVTDDGGETDLDLGHYERFIDENLTRSSNATTGSIYQATVLVEMGAKVFTIERQKELFDKTKHFIFKKEYPNLKFFYGDGFEGLPTFAPFDKILITAAAPHIPPKLVAQLKPGGVMVLPVGEGETQQMCRVTNGENNALRVDRFEQFSFVPMLTGKES